MTASSLVFTLDSFRPTQGQWWGNNTVRGTERRVSLVAAHLGFWLWTADFRDAHSGRIITQRFFCTKPSSEEPVALFENPDDRQRWMQQQWKAQEEANGNH